MSGTYCAGCGMPSPCKRKHSEIETARIIARKAEAR